MSCDALGIFFFVCYSLSWYHFVKWSISVRQEVVIFPLLALSCNVRWDKTGNAKREQHTQCDASGDWQNQSCTLAVCSSEETLSAFAWLRDVDAKDQASFRQTHAMTEAF